MGQYYKPVLLNEAKNKPLAWVYSHDIKYKFERSDGKTFMMGNGLKLMEHSWVANKFVQTIEALLTAGNPWYMQPIVWAGDYADGENGEDSDNIFSMCEDELKATKKKLRLPKKFIYVVNHTKKQYVDKTKVPDSDGWKIHPLPLLTCEGNGRGGGDFRGESELVGSWARDVISIESRIPAGYTELIFDLKED
jgi:hypothetical protein